MWTPDIGEEIEDNRPPYWKDKRRKPTLVYTICEIVEVIVTVGAVALLIIIIGGLLK